MVSCQPLSAVPRAPFSFPPPLLNNTLARAFARFLPTYQLSGRVALFTSRFKSHAKHMQMPRDRRTNDEKSVPLRARRSQRNTAAPCQHCSSSPVDLYSLPEPHVPAAVNAPWESRQSRCRNMIARVYFCAETEPDQRFPINSRGFRVNYSCYTFFLHIEM